jgi:hypothetical protein
MLGKDFNKEPHLSPVAPVALIVRVEKGSSSLVFGVRVGV